MKYVGPLYGKAGGAYFPLLATATDYDNLEAERNRYKADAERLVEALTPSAETKAAYICEFTFTIDELDECGNECQRKILVPWTTIKEIMAAIKARAALAAHEEGKNG